VEALLSDSFSFSEGFAIPKTPVNKVQLDELCQEKFTKAPEVMWHKNKVLDGTVVTIAGPGM